MIRVMVTFLIQKTIEAKNEEDYEGKVFEIQDDLGTKGWNVNLESEDELNSDTV